MSLGPLDLKISLISEIKHFNNWMYTSKLKTSSKVKAFLLLCVWFGFKTWHWGFSSYFFFLTLLLLSAAGVDTREVWGEPGGLSWLAQVSSDSGSDMVLCDCFSLTEALADCGQRGEDRAVPLDGPYDDSSFGLGISARRSFCWMAMLLQEALWWEGDLSWPLSSTSPLSPDPLSFPSVLPAQACGHNSCPKVSQAGIRGQCLCSAHTPGGCSHIKPLSPCSILFWQHLPWPWWGEGPLSSARVGGSEQCLQHPPLWILQHLSGLYSIHLWISRWVMVFAFFWMLSESYNDLTPTGLFLAYGSCQSWKMSPKDIKSWAPQPENITLHAKRHG